MLLLFLAAPPPAPTSEPNPWLAPGAILAYIGFGIAIIAIIFAWRQVYYAKRRQYKELIYSILVDTPLISVDTRAEREKIQIFYDKQEVKDTSLMLLKVWSSGTEDVRIYRHDEKPTDPFESPYWFIFEGRSIVARSILETDPPNFIDKDDGVVYNQTPDPRTDAVSLPHCLLKPKRSFTLRILLTGPKGEIKTEGQLVGCELKQFKPIENTGYARGIRIFLALLLTLAVALTYIILFLFDPTKATFILAPTTALLAVVIGYYFGTSSRSS